MLSSQVLQERVNVLRKRMGHSHERAVECVRPLLGFEIVPVTVSLVEVVYSEDLQHGQTFDEVRIVNPFLS